MSWIWCLKGVAQGMSYLSNVVDCVLMEFARITSDTVLIRIKYAYLFSNYLYSLVVMVCCRMVTQLPFARLAWNCFQKDSACQIHSPLSTLQTSSNALKPHTNIYAMALCNIRYFSLLRRRKKRHVIR